ncbi:MAG: HmuY family protein [Bacteroidia bacterium]|nr:HmuY family protein [Bacteroidia bacterium]
MKKLLCLSLSGLFLFWTACRRPEKPWKLPNSSGGRLIEAHTGPEYDSVAFIRLESGEIHKAVRTAWDLVLKPNSGQGTYQVWLNAALYAFAAPLTETEWQALTDPTQTSSWKCDLADTAALPPLSPGQVLYFLLDRDRGAVFYRSPTERYRKVQVRWEGNILFIRATQLDGSSPVEWQVPVSPDPTYLSLDQNILPSIAPPWRADFLITRYIHPFYDQPEQFRWYPVLGALLGEEAEVAIVRSADIPYENFGYAQVSGLSFTRKRDAIGYDWKRYDFNTGTYTIDFSRFFVLRTGPTTYYKLRFIDFYDAQGRKGNVRIEYEPL